MRSEGSTQPGFPTMWPSETTLPSALRASLSPSVPPALTIYASRSRRTSPWWGGSRGVSAALGPTEEKFPGLCPSPSHVATINRGRIRTGPQCPHLELLGLGNYSIWYLCPPMTTHSPLPRGQKDHGGHHAAHVQGAGLVPNLPLVTVG